MLEALWRHELWKTTLRSILDIKVPQVDNNARAGMILFIERG
jgi:hypothetical protein